MVVPHAVVLAQILQLGVQATHVEPVVAWKNPLLQVGTTRPDEPSHESVLAGQATQAPVVDIY